MPFGHNEGSSHGTLMKRLIALAAATTAAVTLPSASIAATSGTVSASTSIGYSCDITVPGNQALSVTGTNATASADLPFSQNGDTDYSLTALSITSPSAADVSGSITVRDATSAILVQNASTSSSSTGSTNLGLEAGTGSVSFALSEDTATAFAQGAYSISSILSCSESGG